MPTKKTTPDFILMIVTLTLLAVGMIMVYSASAIWADYKFEDSFFFAKRQLYLQVLDNCNVFYHEYRLLDMANMVKDYYNYLFCSYWF